MNRRFDNKNQPASIRFFQRYTLSIAFFMTRIVIFRTGNDVHYCF